jgi:hypothetical protein
VHSHVEANASLLIAIAPMLGAAEPRAQRPPAIAYCADSGAYAEAMIAHLRNVATTADASELRRRSYTMLPATTRDSVVFVSDTAYCKRASWSLRHSPHGADTGQLQTVMLFRYGSSRNIGSDFGKVGDRTGWMVFDTTFAPLIAFAL